MARWHFSSLLRQYVSYLGWEGFKKASGVAQYTSASFGHAAQLARKFHTSKGSLTLAGKILVQVRHARKLAFGSPVGTQRVLFLLLLVLLVYVCCSALQLKPRQRSTDKKKQRMQQQQKSISSKTNTRTHLGPHFQMA